APTDHDHVAAHPWGRTRLQRFDERERVPHPAELVPRVPNRHVRAEPDAEEDGARAGELLRRRRRPEPELDTHALEQALLCWEGLALLAVRRDRVADEAADFLVPLVDR